MSEEILTTPVGKTKNDIWAAYKRLRDEKAGSSEAKLATTTQAAKKKQSEKAIAATVARITEVAAGSGGKK